MADITNQGIPGAGGQLSGDASKQAAIKRLRKQSIAGPNTGPTGLPKPERSYVQMPGAYSQSSTPKRV